MSKSVASPTEPVKLFKDFGYLSIFMNYLVIRIQIR